MKARTYLEGLVGERLFHLGGLLLTRPQTIVVYPLNLAELPLPHLLLLLVHLPFGQLLENLQHLH